MQLTISQVTQDLFTKAEHYLRWSLAHFEVDGI